MQKWAGLLVVLALALAARCYGIRDESVWYDEAVTVASLDAPDLGQAIRQNQELDKLKIPLYLSVEYVWWRITGRSIVGLRALSVLTALLTAAVLYLNLFRWWGNFTALLAGLCFALSRPLLYHGQEIRMYGLMYLFVLVSWFALYAAVRGKRRAWIVNGFCNLLLVNVHLFGAISLAAQFLFLMLESPRSWRRQAAWAAAHACIGLTLVPWLMWFDGYDHAIGWIAPPSPWALIDTFAYVYPGMQFQHGESLSTGMRIAGALMAVIFLAAIVAALRKGWRDPEERKRLLLLLTWMIVPPATLVVASYVWQPCYIDRYALYAALPCIMLAARGVGLARPPLRMAAVAAMAALYLFSFANIVRPMRVDLASAVRLIEAQGQPQDRIVARGMGFGHCLPLYLPDGAARLVPKGVSLKEVVRDVSRGQRTWVIMDEADKDAAQWRENLSEASARFPVASSAHETISGMHPVTVYLLSPEAAADARAEKARPRN